MRPRRLLSVMAASLLGACSESSTQMPVPAPADAAQPQPAPACSTFEDESCQLAPCCGPLRGRRAYLDARCMDRFETDLGCMRTEDGGAGTCPFVQTEDDCIYRETDGGIEVFTGGQAVLPRGYRRCDSALKQRYYDALEGGRCR